MTTNTRTAESEESAVRPQRTAAPHAVEARAAGAQAAATERVLHPLRPAPRRQPRHANGVVVRSRAAAPSSAPRRGASRALVAPTTLPDHSGDLLGLPDLRLDSVRRGLARAWAWLAERVREARDVDARLSARREEDAAIARSKGALTHLL